MLSISRSGQECMRYWEYSALLQKRKLAWDDAEEKSYRTGKPFTNRDGEMVKREDVAVVRGDGLGGSGLLNGGSLAVEGGSKGGRPATITLSC